MLIFQEVYPTVIPRYNVPLCVPPISIFTIEHVLTFPDLPCNLLSPEKHGKTGDYCIVSVIVSSTLHYCTCITTLLFINVIFLHKQTKCIFSRHCH